LGVLPPFLPLAAFLLLAGGVAGAAVWSAAGVSGVAGADAAGAAGVAGSFFSDGGAAVAGATAAGAGGAEAGAAEALGAGSAASAGLMQLGIKPARARQTARKAGSRDTSIRLERQKYGKVTKHSLKEIYGATGLAENLPS